ncbi:hypothetical protein D3OALGA1CA_1107 [Olavius algarvensis associated proteobacterium Delta 3]|nr:hypothetical protein D3OALGA1CA_1107 [Olavius algarvensis associated proteobacterium Delta 3]CAB5140264.1 hypothetical protein D3OALGB2SA_4196 [Olavius algarvensis associated proteobacterium Delta 3]
MQNDRLKNTYKFNMLLGLFLRIPLSGIRGKTVPLRSLRLCDHHFHMSANGTDLWQPL